MKIAYQGIPGAYSEEATNRYIEGLERESASLTIVGYSTFKHLVDDLLNGSVDQIVIPVENSTTGIIARTMDLFRHQDVFAVKEIFVPIRHTLLGIRGSSIERIGKVLSHPEALSQCISFFEEHPWMEAIAYDDTANAALFVKDEQDPTIAALASARAGQLYQLEVLQEHIQTEMDNTTRFYVLEKGRPQKTSGNKLSFYVETSHEPGSLTKLLLQFEKFEANLLSLNARPIANQSFSYGFFIEASFDAEKDSVADLLEQLNQYAKYVQLLGQFQAASLPNE